MLPVYLDHHATTPCDPRVVAAMLPWFTEQFGNAGSVQHVYGLRARSAVDLAREQVAALIGAQPDDIVFTSGATEADNLAVLGIADATPAPGHLVVSAFEHRAVLDAARWLRDRGWTLTEVRPDADGIVSPAAVAAALRHDTALVSVMHANNEVGTIQPIAALADACRPHGIPLHTDAVQTTGRVPVDVAALGVDLLSLSGHKMYGPQGIGALWIRRRGRPRIRITARQIGGGQERGLRSGTLPVPLIVGLGKAAELAAADLRDGGIDRVRALRDRLWAGLAAIDGATFHGSTTHRLPNNVSVRFDGVDADALLAEARHEVAFSAASACSTGGAHASHVLHAIGLDDVAAAGTVRLGLGRTTTDDDVDRALAALRGAVARIRARAPLRPTTSSQ